MDLLVWLDEQQEKRARRDRAFAAAVSGGAISPAVAWPEYFVQAPGEDKGAFPATGSDMSEFELEPATPESFAADIEAIMAANLLVTLREGAPVPAAPVPHHEWT